MCGGVILKEIYLDNSATTIVSNNVCKKMCVIMTSCYGNASSLHTMGIQAENEITTARKTIAQELNVNHNEIYFCSGGTEANNHAIFGTAESRKRIGNRIVTTAIEHSSVLECMNELSKKGFEIEYLMPDISGNISDEKIINAIDNNTILVSLMLVNNEMGSITPVEAAAKAIKFKKLQTLLHCDAVQAFGKMPVKPKKLGVDLMTISSHKIHGPKGVGALYIKDGVRITPIIYGGEQQKKIRPGTENVPGIAGFGMAVSEFSPDYNLPYIKELHDYYIEKLQNTDNVVINSPEDALPYIINFSVPGIRSETMLHFLASKSIFVSSGSACAKGKPSHVLTAMGLDKKFSDSAIRISFSKYNKKNEADIFIEALKEGINTLARAK